VLASADGGGGGDHAIGDVAHVGGSRDLQAVAGVQGQIDLHYGLLQKRWASCPGGGIGE